VFFFRYIARPLLINESKFDMRVYVYVSCYDPLRAYVFEDGLARFASCKLVFSHFCYENLLLLGKFAVSAWKQMYMYMTIVCAFTQKFFSLGLAFHLMYSNFLFQIATIVFICTGTHHP
jgi:hypothetical protein